MGGFLQPVTVSIACYAEHCTSSSKSTHLSACLSVTRWYCVKMTQVTIMRSSLEDNPSVLGVGRTALPRIGLQLSVVTASIMSFVRISAGSPGLTVEGRRTGVEHLKLVIFPLNAASCIRYLEMGPQFFTLTTADSFK